MLSNFTSRCLQPVRPLVAYAVSGLINMQAVFSLLFARQCDTPEELSSLFSSQRNLTPRLFSSLGSVTCRKNSLSSVFSLLFARQCDTSEEKEKDAHHSRRSQNGSPALCGDFNRIKQEVIRSVGDNEDKVQQLLTEKILIEFLQFHSKKRRQLVLRIIPPKKPTDSAPNNFVNIKHNQGKKEKEERKSRKCKRPTKNPKQIKQGVLDQPASMPAEFILKVTNQKGYEIKLIIKKQLTKTNMKASQNRLSIPRGQMRYDFLTMEKQVRLEEKEADGIHFKGLQVPLIEPSLIVSTIFLKKWKLGNNSTYMLGSPWINVAKRNGLKASNTIQLWSFRVNQRPHLALIKLDK